MERRLVDERPVPYAVARALLARRVRSVREGESLGDLTDRTWRYLQRFGAGDEELAEKAFNELVSMGLPPVVAANVVSICPGSRGELRSILEMSKDTLNIWDGEKLDMILAAISEYCETAREAF